MRTRVISTEIWDEDKVFSLNIDTKLLYLILLTNPYIGQTRYYKINDRQLSTFSGLNVEQIQKCKRDLTESKMALFKDGWVCITGYGFVECFYKGTKNEIAKQREIDKIPDHIMEYFNTLSIPYVYPSDTPINTKLEILNNKSEIINTKSVTKTEFGEFKRVKLSDEEYSKLVELCGENNTHIIITEIDMYCASTGKSYKNYYATALNWIRRKGEAFLAKKEKQELQSSKYKSVTI